MEQAVKGNFLYMEKDQFSKIQREVFGYSKLAERIKEYPKEEEKAKHLLKEIAADLRPKTLENFRNLLDYTMMRLYDGIDFDLPAGMDLGKFISENNVIFVPNHQSHVDYLMFSYILHKNHNIGIYIAGGLNLNVFPIGTLFRRSGCFFIRRSFQRNILYKLTLEAYISYLLKMGFPIEFFFEGGRSRTGALQAPKYGLFQILIETHASMPEENKKPLVFLPVSIVHEVVPEQRTLIRESEGSKKKKESFSQLLQLYKVFQRNFGTIHVKINDPVWFKGTGSSLKESTRSYAMECHKAVSNGMKVTPSSVLAMVLLDEPSGSLTWGTLIKKCTAIINFCRRFNISISKSLTGEAFLDSMQSAIVLLLDAKKIRKIENVRLNQTFYVIDEGARIDVQYSKNAISHHFLPAFFINSALINIENGNITSNDELKTHLNSLISHLEREFFLPRAADLLVRANQILADCVGRKLSSFSNFSSFTKEDREKVRECVSPFSNTFRYVYESYYLMTMALRYIKAEKYSQDKILKIAKGIFELERSHGRIVKYAESYTLPAMKNALEYFRQTNVLLYESGFFLVNDPLYVKKLTAIYARELTETLIATLKGEE
ncbi:1-acyl-sn-glycerol-3-phosphate acyltransferase [Bacteriovoracaceae bacterium]|nr:1-acyl-sn-glycerol-3-phosphate acyltransferase [Bacteriovoracaceae bacterium]